jgi:ethanolamine ammonia-lyase small subunit
MTDPDQHGLVLSEWAKALRQLRARTPARLLEGRAGAGYRTETQLRLREAHAAARDAVRVEFDLSTTFDAAFIEKWNLFEASTRARTKDEYLLNPDLGRRFSDTSRAEIAQRCRKGVNLQIAIGDGLSVQALAAQIPALLPLLHQSAVSRGWSFGQVFVIRHCRVGILNEIGELLSPAVVVLLIGERPGLAAADSLSAYMAYCPNASHTDANRNLISNIHARGLSAECASQRIVDLAARMTAEKISGWQLKTGDRNPPLPTSSTERI